MAAVSSWPSWIRASISRTPISPDSSCTGMNFVQRSAAPHVDFGHSTHVAGIIAAATDNGIGVSGVAPGACIMPGQGARQARQWECRVHRGGMSAFAADHGAKVINSLGERAGIDRVADASGDSAALAAALEHAWTKGAVIVAAAGNGSVPLCSERRWAAGFCAHPAARRPTRGQIGVGSVDDAAVNVLSTVGRGTGMDTAHTGYVAGNIYGRTARSWGSRAAGGKRAHECPDRGASACDGDNLGVPGTDPVYGAGAVDAARAVR